MKKTIVFVSFIALAQIARGAMMFGDDDHIHAIRDIELKSPDNQTMQLAHRVTLHFFVAGIYASDKGYVLIEKGKTDQYFELTPDLLKTYQADGTLPIPLPAYSIPVWDYLFGYSLWIIIAGVVLYYIIKDKFFSKKEPVEAPAAPK